MIDHTASQPVKVRHAAEVLIQLIVLALILASCFQIIAPFVFPIIWGLIIAVTVYPLFVWLKSKLRGSGKLASILITIIFLLLLLVPAYMLSGSLIDGARNLKIMVDGGHSPIPPPGDRARALPSFAQPLISLWQQASENLQQAVVDHNVEFKRTGLAVLSSIAKIGVGILSFVVSIVIAGIFLAYAEEGNAAITAIYKKLIGSKGEELAAMSKTTIRSVVKGILGVALIQTFLSGMAFVVVGVPAAGLWTLGCLILAVIQVGVGPIMIPMIIYVFNTSDLTTGILFMIWGIITLLSDNVLKPLLLGRGAPVPMIIVFLGAIGGFIAIGFLGLFLGAVILSLGYKLFEFWLDDERTERTEIRMP